MKLALALSALLAASSAGAFAQVENGQEENTPEALLAIASYGKCVAEREPREAHRLLTMDFTSDRYPTVMRLLSEEARQACARGSVRLWEAMRSDGLLFAGALAEALLEDDATPLNVRLARNAAVDVPSFAPTGALALCLARSLPDQVAALLATTPGSDDETAAVMPLTQAVPDCARAAAIETQVEISVPAVRAMTATAAYRLVAKAGDTNA